jgi:outer membrane protein insertion porin family
VTQGRDTPEHRSFARAGGRGAHGRTRAAAAVLLAAPLAGAGLRAAQPGDQAPPPAPAEAPISEPYEGRPIHAIDLVVPTTLDDGTRTTRALEGDSLQTALNNIRSYEGAPFRADTVNDDVRRLNRLGLFSRVESAAQLLDDGSVRVIFTVVERPVVRDVQAAGNRQIPDFEIAQQIDLLVGTPIDRFQVDRGARRIEDLYRTKGYYFAQVSVDEQLLEESGIVLYSIREGERVKVTDLRFEGNTAFAARQLRRELETETASLLRQGQLDDSKLDTDIANLITFYRDRGYLDVRADRLITPSPNGREAIVTYLIEEGPLYTLRSVTLEIDGDDRVFTAEQLAGLVGVKAGAVYGARDLDASINAIQSAYGALGYADARVTRVEKRDPEQPLVDLVLVVAEGTRFTTGEVIIQGNELTRQEVVRREVEVRPERPLDTNGISRTERNIRRTRLFEQRSTRITLQPPDADEPEYRDVLVEVAETNTGEFNIGGAVSSDGGVVGRISLVQRNFDITDTPDSVGELLSGKAFRGGGQTFRIELLPGDRVETYSIGLSDPALFDTDYSGNVSVFFRSRDYDEFDERRYGTRFGVGRKFGTRWNGNLSFRVESIGLSDIEPDRPTDVFAVEDDNLLTSAAFQLTRNTLDDPYRPTKGASSRVGIEQAGVLGGEFEFTKLSAEHRFFIPIREDYLGRSTVLSIATEVGYIPQGRSDTPTYERFYLGGQTFRGLDFRTVSPKGTRNDNGQPSDDPVGGTWLFFLGAEINQPIFEDIFSLVGFIDSGTVTFDPGFEDYRVTAGLGLRFYVPQLSPAPLAFDFGIPLKKADGDEDRLFTFSVDLPF